ncbi:hypothetical protein [Paenibacillus sonchi]|uniref:hypothetical protein n=1 Tax=Paenibacillus sonchi TaxID=373687 RepID=UPI0038CD9B0C|nr:hypothetical protein [Paenibacillus sonchi]
MSPTCHSLLCSSGSGTGGAGRYGNVGFIPFTGPLRLRLEACDKEVEAASAGYYSVNLLPAGIRTELTNTARTRCH